MTTSSGSTSSRPLQPMKVPRRPRSEGTHGASPRRTATPGTPQSAPLARTAPVRPLPGGARRRVHQRLGQQIGDSLAQSLDGVRRADQRRQPDREQQGRHYRDAGVERETCGYERQVVPAQPTSSQDRSRLRDQAAPTLGRRAGGAWSRVTVMSRGLSMRPAFPQRGAYAVRRNVRRSACGVVPLIRRK